jgi:hypothetical protein
MTHSKLNKLFFLVVGLVVLFAPLLLQISLDEKASAMGILRSKDGNDGSPGNRFARSKPNSDPATMLLVGGGAIGLAALKRKFEKK